jgi:L-ascorbate metabolism protein UlaG (beta-lactamase superfamily)
MVEDDTRLPRKEKRMIRILAAGALALFMGTVFAQGGKTEVLWLGQAAFRITTPGGKVIMIDPWLRTNPKTPAGFKALESVGKIDLILVTHAHFDHFADAPDLAKMHNAPMYGPAGLGNTVDTLGILPAKLAPRFGKGGTIEPFGAGGVKITATRAEHSSELVWKNPATGKNETHPGGEPVGYVLELENGFRIYHMGDTGLFGDMKMIGEMYKPDLVLVPIGGNFTINAQLGAYAIREMIKPRFAIPMHYGTFPILAGKPEDLIRELGPSKTRTIVMNPGEQVEF